MQKRLKMKMTALGLCVIFILTMAGQAFAEEIIKLEDIVGASSENQQVLEAASDAEMIDFSVSEEEIPDELREGNFPQIESQEVLFEEEDIKDSFGPQERASGVTGTDLEVSNLRAPNHTEPFPNMTSIQISATVANRGSTQITGFNYSAYMDGSLLLSKAVQVTMNPNNAVTLNLNFTGKVGGTHTVLVSVWLPNGTAEVTTANNSVSRAFKWEDCVALRALSFQTPNGATELETNADHEFEARIANLGTISVRDVPVAILDGVKIIASSNIDFPAGKIANISITLRYDKKPDAPIKLGVYVDPNHKSGDVDYSDNAVGREVTITYDLEDWAGKWADARHLEVQIHSSILEFCKSDGAISASQVTNAIQDWNGISSRVSFDKVRQSPMDAEEDDMMDGVQFHVYSYRDPEVGVIGQTLVYKKDKLSGEFIQIPPEDLYTDNSNYSQARIYLNEPVMLKLNVTSQKKTVTHEFGHALGLAHPTCKDKAIMWQTQDSEYVSFTITEHDEYNIRSKYQ